MDSKPRKLKIYTAANGHRPFELFMTSIEREGARGPIASRLERVRLGSLGDWKALREGVCEFRIHFGPGYRVYFGIEGDLVILLCGGKKARQARDIARAVDYWRDYNA